MITCHILVSLHVPFLDENLVLHPQVLLLLVGHPVLDHLLAVARNKPEMSDLMTFYSS